MRTLIDLFSNDAGFVRVYAEREGYGYQLSTYAPRVTSDLFETMSGYDSMDAATAAALQQLSSVLPKKRRRAKNATL